MPISLNCIDTHRAVLEEIGGGRALKEAEGVVLNAAKIALSEFQRHEKIYQYALQDCRSDIVEPKYQLQASVGITFLNPEGQVLLEKMRNGAYGIFRRKIEESDFAKPNSPVTISAVHRELKKSNLKLISEVLGCAILNRSTLMLPNKDSKQMGDHFWAEPVYMVQLSECSDQVVEAVNEAAKKAMGFAWADLSEILHQQDQIDADHAMGMKELASEKEFFSRAQRAEKLFDIQHRPLIISANINGEQAKIRVEDSQRTFATSKEILRTLLGRNREEMKG